MGRRGERYNAKARSASHTTHTAKPHAQPRTPAAPAASKAAPADASSSKTATKSTKKAQPASLAPAGTAEPVQTTAALTGAAASVDAADYQGSTTAIPEVLPSKEQRQADAAAVVAERIRALPDQPADKITSKKRKRLEKFIEKELKKEERVKLLEKLSSNKFSSELLFSSKRLGQGSMTARERLRMALLEERSGVPRSDPSIHLVVEKASVDSSAAGMDMDDSDDFAGDDDEDDDDDNDADAEMDIDGGDNDDGDDDQAAGGIVSRAFGAASEKPGFKPVVMVSSERGTTAAAAADDTETDGLKMSVSLRMLSSKPVVGSGLKRKTADGASADASAAATEPSKRQIKKLKKAKAKEELATAGDGVSAADELDSSESSGHESEDDRSSTAIQPAAPRRVKTIWASDIVSGEKLEGSQPAKTTSSAAASQPAQPQPQQPKRAPAGPVEKAFHVPVHRSEAMQVARMALPVVGEEQPIMESILANDVVILCGETGSGKTTQVPQFLYEAGFGDKTHPKFPGMIGVTQPRRVAAVSMAKRVADEMSLKKGEVAYQIRYDKGLTGTNTRIKFMTDGVLLRELSGGITPTPQSQSQSQAKAGKNPGKTSSDILLSDYSCIIIDEAHERTVGTDVLIGWLTRIVRLRNSGKLQGVHPLKLVIMSATLRVEDFTENPALFPAAEARPPVIKVDGRQHKVVVHYNKKTPDVDYVSEAYKKICKIHTRLPPGGVLVFMTGQNEVQTLVRKLKRAYAAEETGDDVASGKSGKDGGKDKETAKDGDAETAGADNVFGEVDAMADAEEEQSRQEARGRGDQAGGLSGTSGRDDFEELEAEELEMQEDDDAEEEEVHVLGGTIADEEDDDEDEAAFVPPTQAGPVHVLPLYSLLPTHAQLRVFEAPPEGARLIVIATNVAETSLTIPGIKYVVDCGKVKERRYDTHTGLQTFQITWTSKASADQRAGRAGRMGPGHCYRLFSSAVFNDYFDLFSVPEILRVPIEDVALQMKSMGINQVVNFPFPTAPERESLRLAERLLKFLGALDTPANSSAAAGSSSGAVMPMGGRVSDTLAITDTGRLMSKLPVSPRYSKMLLVAAKQSQPVLPYIIAIVSGLSVGDPFVRDDDIINDKRPDSDDEGDGRMGDAEKEARRKKRGHYFKVMQAFGGTNPTSDLLRLLGAIGAYTAELTRKTGGMSIERFCEQHFLRPKAMDEIAKLRSQLTNLLKTILSDSPSPTVRANLTALSVDPRMAPPSQPHQSLIRQIILTGFPDKVARLSETVVSGWGQHAMPVYQTLWTDLRTEHHLIHPSSALYRERPAPKWIVYNEVIGREERLTADRTGVLSARGGVLDANAAAGSASGAPAKRWLRGVTSVNEPWLSTVCPPALVRTGRVLDQPEPRYVPDRDVVAGFVVPVFGPALWELGTTETTKDLDANTQTMWFAKALLEGHVLAAIGGTTGGGRCRPARSGADVFAMMLPFMPTKPSVVTKSWAKSQAKVSRLLDTLGRHQVTTRLRLVEQWTGISSAAHEAAGDKTFLLDVVKMWVPEEFHATLGKHWPPVVRSKAAAGSGKAGRTKGPIAGVERNEALYSALAAVIAGTASASASGSASASAAGRRGRRHTASDSDEDSS
ncbi:P-loop containing nucleoside triphosphate hydrolase protein [Entophlyctis helioformis]|nr:P-loop containing nucleoside triphosphate hydrolase protein [Entophlyctis helioformis]